MTQKQGWTNFKTTNPKTNKKPPANFAGGFFITNFCAS